MSLSPFLFTTTAEEGAVILAEDIGGKNVLITGTSMNGISFETALVLAKYASLVVTTGHNVESESHAFGNGVNFSTLGSRDSASYVPMDMYYQMRTANILNAIELSKRSKGEINVYSLTPGLIYTNLMRQSAVMATLQGLDILDSDGLLQGTERFVFRSIPQGAATTVVAAFDLRLNGR
ncbi:hypothetical protein B0H17DRAFT_1186456 [Mycena rosella]|uniref:Uncharacterized protein n=1 Tax=Mycena rosella TaxID=1033263 RepID=A0AAD7CM07_MYCRO|nr:hypothetical protein B0H17DRAFT_1186456 [Mycena rosella]